MRLVSRNPSPSALPPAQQAAEKLFSAFERFLHIEAVSGLVLLVAAATALIWANSSFSDSYHHFWDAPITIGAGGYTLSRSLHFLINEGLMTIFFLVVGMEIRREMHEGALANLRLAALPLAAALGGIAVPAAMYLAFNHDAMVREGWAVPTATDIAFAVGVLALLGKSVPASIRIILLALAIIDDIAAVMIIAVFYSGGLDYSGLLIAGTGILLVLALQSIGVGTAFAYLLPGAILWLGLLKTGAHPTLAGVVLGLMTPVVPLRMRAPPLDEAANALNQFGERANSARDPHQLFEPLKRLRLAQRELMPPAVRVQMALHPWVAFGVMPLFALANAGVSLEGVEVAAQTSQMVMLGVVVALVVGKPLGIVLGSWCAVRCGWCRLPGDVSWRGMWLIGCLGGIGFTMSIFIANLAFTDPVLLGAAKLGVLLASLTAGIAGLLYGRYFVRTAPAQA
jgi:NhaA family Na+:H+ antiporter